MSATQRASPISLKGEINHFTSPAILEEKFVGCRLHRQGNAEFERLARDLGLENGFPEHLTFQLKGISLLTYFSCPPPVSDYVGVRGGGVRIIRLGGS